MVNKITSSIPEDKLLNTLKAKGTLNLKNSSKIDVKDLFTEIHKQHTNKITTTSNNKNVKRMIRDTFLYKEWKEKADLKSINTNNSTAPKWAKELGHKERK